MCSWETVLEHHILKLGGFVYWRRTLSTSKRTLFNLTRKAPITYCHSTVMPINSREQTWSCCREEPILTPFWNCFFDLLLIAFVIIIILNGLPKGPHPSAQLLKCLCSAHRKIIWLCPHVNGCKKEEINTLFSQAGHFQGCFARLMASFTLLSPFLLYERVLSIFVPDMHTACHGCRPWITMLCLSQLV